ncbi:uncharacterized protein [Halyomorpha halys]|uniref:uncharacterized protein isoform X1 n=2 Tax=Halyomorpha halys TaxID=286706 RepID=UPI0034D29636
MLAVLKKRWKPKRAAGNVNNNNNNAKRSVKSIIIEPGNMQLETGGDKIRVSVSPRQVHPVSEICPAPNICVQGGRIEFIRPNTGTPDHVKEKLEARIAELEAQLEEEKKSTLKERRNTARFQALIEDRESLAKDVEYERGVRQTVECKLEEATLEADYSKRRVQSLQETCHRSVSFIIINIYIVTLEQYL